MSPLRQLPNLLAPRAASAGRAVALTCSEPEPPILTLLHRVFEPLKTAGYLIVRASTALSSSFSAAQASQPAWARSRSPGARRRSPHPATNRLVQEAFRIGFAMRKALS